MYYFIVPIAVDYCYQMGYYLDLWVMLPVPYCLPQKDCVYLLPEEL